ncbi:hypothetical protein SAMN06272765_7276 [Streptomyces sp. Ag109_G2-15]|nr:hypothetical protein SAMN06272765_7276 [Streptomyces sp. Ag109_G2-15]
MTAMGRMSHSHENGGFAASSILYTLAKNKINVARLALATIERPMYLSRASCCRCLLLSC